jgi:hypothetical protein
VFQAETLPPPLAEKAEASTKCSEKSPVAAESVGHRPNSVISEARHGLTSGHARVSRPIDKGSYWEWLT